MIRHLVTASADFATKDDIEALQKTLDEHTKILDDHTKILNEHTGILNDHTRRLATIENDVKTNLDKRLTLEVRVTNIEKEIFGASQERAA